MLGHKNDFIGVSSPSNWPIFSSICPNPNLLFKTQFLNSKKRTDQFVQINYRKQHLGKSLSLSYDKPLKIMRGEMQYLMDEFGQKYLDTVNNVAHAGHEHPKVVEAGQQQMSVLNTNTRYLNDEILDFAEELLATFPEELSVIHFVNSGSEANELALRMAKAMTGEKDIIALEIGYHGNTQGCIDISSYKFDGKGGKGCPENTHIVPLPDAFRGIYQGENTGEKYAKHVEEAILKIQSKNRNVAAFIAESIVSCGGQIDLPEGYLKDAYRFVRKEGGICIADEVQVGFGRVGKAFWGFQLHGVVPDIVTMGKPIGNGHPMAAVVCTRAVADAFANGMEFFNTFGGNPVSCAIGRRVLQVIKEDKLQENALEVGEYLKKQLKSLKENYPIIADVRGEGLFLGIELVDENKTPLPDQTNYLANRMKDFKILMSIDGPQHNVLKIKPPMCFSKANADYMMEVLTKVLSESFMIN
jgi:4-aminobutyrate aminotransferase-like enzyme